jgi:trans-aconitate methyltransferase
MSTKLIYRSASLYELVNRALYGRHHAARYRVIADLIPKQSTVVDLCCGPAVLYHRYLRNKSVRYTGLDISPSFIQALNERGGHGLLWDLHSDRPLPCADYLVIQGALYFFLPDASPLIRRMLAAASRQVIIQESIRNLSSSRSPLVSNVAMRLAGVAKGNHPPRFTEATLDRLFKDYPPERKRFFKIPGGRDKVYVLEKLGGVAAVR